jgi:predicted dehydrogenase
MALDMTSQQKELGKENFRRASKELSRRGFLKGLLAAGTAVPVAAAAYYGYNFERWQGKPVRTALIGAGDEGGVLIGEHNPKYLEFVAYSDIRPFNQKRIFEGEKAPSPRKGFNFHYGNDAEKKIKKFPDYKELLADTSLGIEAVVIALPLHLHAPVAIAALDAGKHVLCEKLMAWNITQCKDMIKKADETGKILTIGHQRHYSLLYAQASEAIKSGMLGDIKHIRALWHRNNSWPRVDENGKVIEGSMRDGWKPKIEDEDRKVLENDIRKWGYKSMEELVRWRLFNRTGGGLMAELGSHQLDACSIFLGKVHPLAVSGVGGKFFYTDDREVDDSVFVTFEFPGPTYYVRDREGKPTKDINNKNDIVVVTYSSLNTSGFEKYGECVVGSRGTMVVEQEQSVMLFAEPDPNQKDFGAPRATAVTVTSAPGGAPALESTASYGGSSGPGGAKPAGAPQETAEAVSRGYREEMEHFAYCIRMQGEAKSEEKRKWQLEPHCHGRVAMADAIIALTSNQAMRKRERIVFKPEWFEVGGDVPDKDMVPEVITG